MSGRSLSRPRRVAIATVLGLAAALALAGPSAAVEPTAFGHVIKPAAKQNYPQARAASEQRYGRPGVIRYFDSNAPDSWATFNTKLTDHTGIISFRIAPTTVLSGAADSQLRTWFSQAPTTRVTYWSYMHEPEDDIVRGAFTKPDYRAAWAHIAQIARSVGNDRLKATLILMCYTVNKASKRTWTDYYSPGDIDVLGWDCYNHGEARGVYGEPATLYQRAIDVSRSTGLPWGMAEFGSRLAAGDSTGAGRAAWLRKVSRYFADQGAQFASYFNTNGAGSDYRLLDEPSRQAWYDVVSDQTP